VPDSNSTTNTLALVAIFALAGWVKGVLGLGQPTVAMALLGLTMPAQRAAALLVVPSLVTNLWQAFAGGHTREALRRFWPLLATIVLGTWAGFAFFGTRLGGRATAVLGAVLVVYGVYGLVVRPLTVTTRAERWFAPMVGLITGVLNAATGVSVMPLVPYLQSLGLPKETLVQTLGLTFFASTVALGAGLGMVTGMNLSGVDLTIPLLASLAGMAAGQSLRKRLAGPTFRRIFFISLVLLGSYLAVKNSTT
jgi:uncharacterized membrane protein YfcA